MSYRRAMESIHKAEIHHNKQETNTEQKLFSFEQVCGLLGAEYWRERQGVDK
uniref:Uncharacterized protein n=1 Tax=Rhizophora mucronata TaxID=61149 RepID=A0A2P2PJF9_RHIMU